MLAGRLLTKSRKADSRQLRSGRWLGHTTPGQVIRRKLLFKKRFGRITFWAMARANYSPEGGSAEIPSGWWFGGITPGKVVRKKLPPATWFPQNYARDSASGKLLSGRWFGLNYLRENASGKLRFGRYFGRNHSREGGANVLNQK